VSGKVNFRMDFLSTEGAVAKPILFIYHFRFFARLNKTKCFTNDLH